MIRNYTVNDSQPQACAFADAFGCEIRFKDAIDVFGGYAITRVANGQLYVRSRFDGQVRAIYGSSNVISESSTVIVPLESFMACAALEHRFMST